MKVQTSMRKGGKYPAEREWAYDLIANSTGGVTVSEMADMMAEQFGKPKDRMGATLRGMIKNGSLRETGHEVHNGKGTSRVVAVRRRPTASTTAKPLVAADPPAPTPAPVTNGSGVYVLVNTVNGPVQLTVEQAKALSAGLAGLFK